MSEQSLVHTHTHTTHTHTHQTTHTWTHIHTISYTDTHSHIYTRTPPTTYILHTHTLETTHIIYTTSHSHIHIHIHTHHTTHTTCTHTTHVHSPHHTSTRTCIHTAHTHTHHTLHSVGGCPAAGLHSLGARPWQLSCTRASPTWELPMQKNFLCPVGSQSLGAGGPASVRGRDGSWAWSAHILGLTQRPPLAAQTPAPKLRPHSISWAWGYWPPRASEAPPPPLPLSPSPSPRCSLESGSSTHHIPMFSNSWLSLIKPHSAGFHLARN